MFQLVEEGPVSLSISTTMPTKLGMIKTQHQSTGINWLRFVNAVVKASALCTKILMRKLIILHENPCDYQSNPLLSSWFAYQSILIMDMKYRGRMRKRSNSFAAVSSNIKLIQEFADQRIRSLTYRKLDCTKRPKSPKVWILANIQ